MLPMYELFYSFCTSFNLQFLHPSVSLSVRRVFVRLQVAHVHRIRHRARRHAKRPIRRSGNNDFDAMSRVVIEQKLG
jgi:hypothetical protein